MKLFSLKIFLVCFLLSINGLASAQESSIGGLVVFGDSLSDTGNLASVSSDFPFPFYENRISNGPILVDFLAAELGLQALASRHTQTTQGGNNFAISGGNIVGDDVEDLGSQVSAFLAREGGRADPSNMYFLMMGGNDLRDIRSIRSLSEAQARIQLVSQKFEQELNRLYDAGARVFLIANVADVGLIPESIERQASDPDISQRARAYVEIYNQQLALVLQRLQSRSGVSSSMFDLFSELNRLVNNAASLGFTQTQVGCFTLERFSFHVDCLFGTRFDRFIFFDSIHPSARANSLTSAALIASIPELSVEDRAINLAPILQLLLD